MSVSIFPQENKNDRKNQIIELQHDISLDRNESFIGKEIRVLVDQSENNIGVGRTEYDSPEIDNIVKIEGKVSKGERSQKESVFRLAKLLYPLSSKKIRCFFQSHPKIFPF